MREFNQRKRIIVGKYTNTPPFHEKILNGNSDFVHSVYSHAFQTSEDELGRPYMNLKEIRRIYSSKDNSKGVRKEKNSIDIPSKTVSNMNILKNHLEPNDRKILQSIKEKFPIPQELLNNLNTTTTEHFNNQVTKTPTNTPSKKNLKNIPNHALMNKLMKDFDFKPNIFKFPLLPLKGKKKCRKLRPSKSLDIPLRKDTSEHRRISQKTLKKSSKNLEEKSVNDSYQTGSSRTDIHQRNIRSRCFQKSHDVVEKSLKEKLNECRSSKSIVRFENIPAHSNTASRCKNKLRSNEEALENKTYPQKQIHEDSKSGSTDTEIGLCLMKKQSTDILKLRVTSRKASSNNPYQRKDLHQTREKCSKDDFVEVKKTFSHSGLRRKYEEEGTSPKKRDVMVVNPFRMDKRATQNDRMNSRSHSKSYASTPDLLSKFRDQNNENYELIKRTLRNYSFEKHFPEFKNDFRKRIESGDLQSKSLRSLYRQPSDRTVVSSMVSHVIKPEDVNRVSSDEILDMSVSRCCDLNDQNRSFVRQQVEKFNELTGAKEKIHVRRDMVENIKTNCRGTTVSKPRSKFKISNTSDDRGCTLVESIKRKVSIYKLHNKSEDEDDDNWTDEEEYTTRITFPRETRHAMSMLLNRSTGIELQENEKSASSISTDSQDHINFPDEDYVDDQDTSKLEIRSLPCPKNLLCNKGLHHGACSVKWKTAWPGIAERVSTVSTYSSHM